MIIVATRVNLANHAGRILFNEKSGNPRSTLPVRHDNKLFGRQICHEADPRLRSARKNRPGNRNNGTRQSAGTSENRKSPSKVASTRWPSCANTRQPRQPCSRSAPARLTGSDRPPCLKRPFKHVENPPRFCEHPSLAQALVS